MSRRTFLASSFAFGAVTLAAVSALAHVTLEVREAKAGADFEGKDETSFVAEFAGWLETEGKKLIPATDTYLLNQLDEVVALAYRTKYKLENLK